MDCNSTIFYQLRKTSCFRDSNPTGAKPIYRRARNLALASSRGHSPVVRYPTLYQAVVDTRFPLYGRGKCGYWLSAKSCEVYLTCKANLFNIKTNSNSRFQKAIFHGRTQNRYVGHDLSGDWALFDFPMEILLTSHFSRLVSISRRPSLRQHRRYNCRYYNSSNDW